MATHHSDLPVLDTYQAVVAAFSEFLIVAIHTIIYERNIYPQASFISARKYNYPVKQNRHPKVCQWIQDAVAAVEVEMLKVMVSISRIFVRFGFRRFAFPYLKTFSCCSCFKVVLMKNVV